MTVPGSDLAAADANVHADLDMLLESHLRLLDEYMLSRARLSGQLSEV